MDFVIYNIMFYFLLALAYYSIYSKHRTLAAISGVGFLILGFFILLSPLQTIIAEVISYA